jgi:M6 family metalloprotease-like protein
MPVILVNFADTSTTQTNLGLTNLLFGEGVHSLNDYLGEMTRGSITITSGPFGVMGWYRARQGHGYYGANDADLWDVWPGTLVREAVAAADARVDFSLFDPDGDCYTSAVTIIHQGTGEEASGDPDDIWSHSWDLNSAHVDGYGDGGEYVTDDPCAAGGFVRVNDYTLQPEMLGGGMQTVGVFAHEFGHSLGMIDLYDLDYSSHGVGDWSLMGTGAWNGLQKAGDRPALPDPWNRIFLGLASPQPLAGHAPGISLEPSARTGRLLQLGQGDLFSGEYHLVENRRRIPGSFDEGLPGQGLLVWHVDGDWIADHIFSGDVNDHECLPGDPSCAERHYGVSLVQADGLGELERNLEAGDACDPFPGACGQTSLTPSTHPSSARHDGADSHLRITGISPAGEDVTADYLLDPLCGDYLCDAGFEGGDSGGWWVATHSAGTSPFCTIGACGGTGPAGGTGWARLGVADSGPAVVTLSQGVTVPLRRQATLALMVRVGETDPADHLTLSVDGVEILRVTGDGPGGEGYLIHRADLSPFADGLEHQLLITARVSTPETFLLDDLGIEDSAPILAQDFSGLASLPPPWRSARGNWEVAAGSCRAAADGSNLAVLDAPPSTRPTLRAGSYQARIRLDRRHPAAMLIFGYLSPSRYRHVTFVPGGTVIGQAGAIGCFRRGGKRSFASGPTVGRWFKARVDLAADGLVTVRVNGRRIGALRFPGGVAGDVGFGAVGPGTAFDNLRFQQTP